MKKNIAFVVMATLGLAACGGGGGVTPPDQSIPRYRVDNPDFAKYNDPNYDYVGDQIVPYLQAQYGDLEITGNVLIQTDPTANATNLHGRTMSWATLYQQYVEGIIVVSEGQGGGSFTGWGNVNYQGVNSYIGGQAGWGQGSVTLHKVRQVVSFSWALSQLISTNQDLTAGYYSQCGCQAQVPAYYYANAPQYLRQGGDGWSFNAGISFSSSSN